MLKNSYKKTINLSIIVPIYNVEKYVHSCFESIFSQGLDENEFEVIIVNDGTKDKSMEMIDDIIKSHSNIIVINQDNQGVSVARNNGIAQARGEYLLMPDSDDLLVDGSVKPMLEYALKNKPEMIVADYLVLNDDEILHLDNSSNIQRNEFSAIEVEGNSLLRSEFCRHHWRTMYSRKFIIDNHLCFVQSTSPTEDVLFSNECFLKVKECFRTSWILNIYRKGHTSASSRYSLEKAKKMTMTIKNAWDLIKLEGLTYDTIIKQRNVVFSLFREQIYAITYGHLKDAKEMIQAIDFLKKEVPEMEFKIGYQQKIWNIMYKRLPTPLFARIIYCLQQCRRRFS